MVIKRKSVAMLLGVAVVGVSASFVKANPVNLVTNGSFEDPGYSGSFETVPPPTNVPTDWVVTPTVDYISDYWTAQDGHYSLDMSGNYPGAVSQTLNSLVVGKTYALTFWMSGNPDGPPLPTKSLDVSVGGASLGTFNYTLITSGLNPNTETNMRWQERYATFQATASSEVLQFTSPANPDTPYGAALDNVSVVAVPLPAAAGVGFGMLGGAALLASYRKRFRRAPRIAV